MAKILVTGGAGYLGSIMVPALLDQGHEVTVLDNFMYGENSLAAVCSHKKFSVQRGDVRDDRTIKEAIKDKDILIPLAALVGAPLCNLDPIGAHTTNLEAPLKLFSMAASSQMILMPTTNSAYGSGNADNYCDETTPLRPLSTYAKHKVEVESALMQRENAISFRLATAFGMSPRMRIDLLVNDMTYRAVHDRFVVLYEGHFKRNYAHVKDIARVFLHGIENFSKMRGEIFNVGLSDANLSKKELCQEIKTFIPSFSILEESVGKDEDQRNYIVSNKKLEATGFEMKHHLRDGIEELVKGFTMLRNTRYGNV